MTAFERRVKRLRENYLAKVKAREEDEAKAKAAAEKAKGKGADKK